MFEPKSEISQTAVVEAKSAVPTLRTIAWSGPLNLQVSRTLIRNTEQRHFTRLDKACLTLHYDKCASGSTAIGLVPFLCDQSAILPAGRRTRHQVFSSGEVIPEGAGQRTNPSDHTHRHKAKDQDLQEPLLAWHNRWLQGVSVCNPNP